MQSPIYRIQVMCEMRVEQGTLLTSQSPGGQQEDLQEEVREKEGGREQEDVREEEELREQEKVGSKRRRGSRMRLGRRKS